MHVFYIYNKTVKNIYKLKKSTFLKKHGIFENLRNIFKKHGILDIKDF